MTTLTEDAARPTTEDRITALEDVIAELQQQLKRLQRHTHWCNNHRSSGYVNPNEPATW